jgi:hypothetical protein
MQRPQVRKEADWLEIAIFGSNLIYPGLPIRQPVSRLFPSHQEKVTNRYCPAEKLKAEALHMPLAVLAETL